MYEKVLADTDRKLSTRPFPEQIRRVCGCRPKALVLREKDLTPQAYRELAEQVLEICGEYQVDCILHNFTGAARELGVKRIHLPLKKLLSLSAEERRPSPASALPCIPRNRPVRLWRRGLPGCLPATFTKASARRDCLPEAWNF